jgi:hypothetical protein
VTRHRILILPTAALAVLLTVSACTQSASTAPQTTPSSAPSAAPGGAQPSGLGGGPGGPGGGFAGGDFAKIQQCLQAAGLSLPTGSFAPPSGAFPSGRFPSGSFPSGSFPSGSFAPPGGLGGALNDPKIQQALAACGISLPGGAPAPSN